MKVYVCQSFLGLQKDLFYPQKMFLPFCSDKKEFSAFCKESTPQRETSEQRIHLNPHIPCSPTIEKPFSILTYLKSQTL